MFCLFVCFLLFPLPTGLFLPRPVEVAAGSRLRARERELMDVSARFPPDKAAARPVEQEAERGASRRSVVDGIDRAPPTAAAAPLARSQKLLRRPLFCSTFSPHHPPSSLLPPPQTPRSLSLSPSQLYTGMLFESITALNAQVAVRM